MSFINFMLQYIQQATKFGLESLNAQPFAVIEPKAFATSIMTDVPEFGSIAPYVQES